MKRFVFWGIYVFCLSMFSQVVGNVKLEGQSDYSNIKVLFRAVSPTAVDDDVYTEPNGDYSKTLAAGTYSVIFEKKGYIRYQLPQNIFVNGSDTIKDVLLKHAILKKVSGNVSGVWSKDTVYEITNFITIPAGDSLHVNPGVSIYLNHNVENYMPLVYVYGKLSMQGAMDDSIKIVPEIAGSTKDMISFWTKNNAKFSYISSSTNAFNVYNANDVSMSSDLKNEVSHSSFMSFGMKLNGNNEVYDNKITYAIFSSIDDSKGKSNMYCNLFDYYDNTLILSQGGHSLSIHHNVFNNGTLGKLYTSDTSSVVFSHNYVAKHLDKLILSHNGHSLEFKNNTFGANTLTYLDVYGKYSGLRVVNNIFENAGLHTDVANPVFDFANNQYNPNTVFVNMLGAGVPINTNTKGSKTDTYGNVIEVPTFTKSPLLQTDSPLIGAGLNGSNIGFDPKETCLVDYFSHWYTPKSADTLYISGKVYVTNGSVLNTTVKAVNLLTNKEYTVLTDQAGSFAIDSLPLGTYYVVTSPDASLSGQYQLTYYPKKDNLSKAEKLNLKFNITNMKIYLIPAVNAVSDSEFIANVYPNPFQDEIMVKGFAPSELQITNVLGQTFHTAKLTEGRIDTHTWPKGIYLVKFNHKALRFVKE